MHFHGIEIWAGGSWLELGDDGPGTMMVRTPSCISVMTFSTYFLVRETSKERRDEANCSLARNSHGSIKPAEPPLFNGEASIRKHGLRLARNCELFHAGVRASGQGNFQITLLQTRELQHRLHEVGILIIKDIRPDGIIALNHSRLQRKRSGR